MSSKAYVPVLMQPQRISRGIRPVGEVFALALKDYGYMYGAVIRNDCAMGAINELHNWKRQSGQYLVYVYKILTQSIDSKVKLQLNKILFAPVIIGGGGWSRGYFLPIRTDCLVDADVLPCHCFEYNIAHLTEARRVALGFDSGIARINEYGKPVSNDCIWCRPGGYAEYGFLENEIISAMGISL